MNLITPISKNSTGKITFYVFEGIALVFFFIEFIVAIVNAAKLSSFSTFVNSFMSAVVYTAIIYALGRIIDILAANKLDNSKEDKKPEKQEEKEEYDD